VIDGGWRGLYDYGAFFGRMMMAKSRLKTIAASIGSAVGTADRRAHKMVKAGSVAKKELAAISKQIDALKKQLQTTTKRMKKALS
jgi:seryl-tRNA synthetase